MRLNRLSADHPKSKAIRDRIAVLATQGQLNTQIDAKRVESIKLIPIDGDIRNTAWAVAISIAYATSDNKQAHEKIFVKKPGREVFEKERDSVNLLRSIAIQFDPEVIIPKQFIESDSLIIAPLIEGQNAKWLLRKCLIAPWSAKPKDQLAEQFGSYGRWLAKFHRTKISSEPSTNPNKLPDGLENLLFASQASIVRTETTESLLSGIRLHLERAIGSDKLGLVHGDFGPQNVIVTSDSFHVIDWEFFHLGSGIEDCIHFVINVLTQARHVPYDFAYVKRIIDSFVRGYTAEEQAMPYFAALVPLLAISNIYKRQEWAGQKFSIYERIFFLPFLRRLAEHYYEQWISIKSEA